jgi:glutathione S-transferase
MNRTLDVATALAASVVRLGAGARAGHAVTTLPKKLLELYEFEGCPFCRKLREALTELDLDVLVHPCPKGGHRFRDVVQRLGHKAQFPFLVDPNTGKSLYESADIAVYLGETYGGGWRPGWLGPLTTLSASLASAIRVGHGTAARPSRLPDTPLELWSFEASPYCRIVRERLTELELPYVLHNVGKSSTKRDAFFARSGRMMVPFLVDPNTKREMFESKDIVEYLEAAYAA